MRYLKTFESMVDGLNNRALIKKQESEGLTVIDILANYDIWCGNHTNPSDKTDICGHSFGVRSYPYTNTVNNLQSDTRKISDDKWAQEILKEKCPDCGMKIGSRVVYISDEDQNRPETLFGPGRTGIELPGTGFYLLPKGTDFEAETEVKQSGSGNKIEAGFDEQKKPINSTEIYKHIEKYINVLADALVDITTQRYRETFTKEVIRRGLVRLQQECKFNDPERTEAAIKVFRDLMAPMMQDNTKNIQTWKLGSNGKKYGGVFNDFFSLVFGIKNNLPNFLMEHSFSKLINNSKRTNI